MLRLSILLLISYASYGLTSWGNVDIDYITWKGDTINNNLGFLFKDTNIYIKTKHINNLTSFLNFNFNYKKIEYTIKEAYIKTKIKSYNLELKLGKIYPFYDLEDNTPSKDRLFMETSSLQGTQNDNLFGTNIYWRSGALKTFFYFLIPEINKNTTTFFSLIRCFINKNFNDNIIHIGINYKEIINNETDIFKKSAISLLDTPFLIQPYSYLRTHYANLPSYKNISYEFIGLFKALLIQSELSFIRAGWRDFDVELYKSFNIQLSYILTNNYHNYNFKKGYIKNPIIENKLGLFELTFKYSLIDVRSKGSLISGVCKTDSLKHMINIGTNWYINKNTQIKINYAYENFIYKLNENKKIHNVGIGIRFSF